MKAFRFTLVGLAFVAATSVARASDAVGQLREYLKTPSAERADLSRQPFASVALTKTQAADARHLLWNDLSARLRAERAAEWEKQSITIGDKTMQFTPKFFGNKPKNGWNLYISLHGGGNAPAAVNDQQWKNQAILYEPADSLYIAPRAPTDTWNLWHEPHVDLLLGRLIDDAVLLAGVDPNRVYLMGYSAGGDGVYQLAPRMADRFAAAAMMAGHPNDASPSGLRNLPFTIHVGALDDGYGRNAVARDWAGKLDALNKADPGGYTHEVTLHEGMGHWMKRQDAVAVAWMAKYTRDPLPMKVVWQQGHAPHDRFYWLAVPTGSARKEQAVVAVRDGQTIDLVKVKDVAEVDVLLNDDMLDLDRPVVVRRGGKVVFDAVVPRTIGQLERSVAERLDDATAFAAVVRVRTGG